MSFIEPALIIDLTKLKALRLALLLTVAVFPSFEVSQPPAWIMKTPRRWNSGPVQSPTWLEVVSFFATDASCAQVVG